MTVQPSGFAIQASDVCKSFGSNLVLRSVSFGVLPGTTLSILGPSGSGKSTLLRCLNFLEIPDSGKIYINGEEVLYRNPASKLLSESRFSKIRVRFGMVFQHFNLWPHMTVLQNVIEGPIRVQRRPKQEVLEEAMLILGKIGLQSKRDEYPSRLSGGQKQRVAIARALAMRPEILLFDEPTSSLDPELVGEVLQVMRGLSEEGQTMIVVTHEMDFARDASDEVIFMDDGRIVESAKPAEFFVTPKTERARNFLNL